MLKFCLCRVFTWEISERPMFFFTCDLQRFLLFLQPLISPTHVTAVYVCSFVSGFDILSSPPIYTPCCILWFEKFTNNVGEFSVGTTLIVASYEWDLASNPPQPESQLIHFKLRHVQIRNRHCICLRLLRGLPM